MVSETAILLASFYSVPDDDMCVRDAELDADLRRRQGIWNPKMPRSFVADFAFYALLYYAIHILKLISYQ